MKFHEPVYIGPEEQARTNSEGPDMIVNLDAAPLFNPPEIVKDGLCAPAFAELFLEQPKLCDHAWQKIAISVVKVEQRLDIGVLLVLKQNVNCINHVEDSISLRKNVASLELAKS